MHGQLGVCSLTMKCEAENFCVYIDVVVGRP